MSDKSVYPGASWERVRDPHNLGWSRKNLASVLRGALVQCLLPKVPAPGRVAAYGYVIPDDAFREAIVEGTDLTKGPTPLPEGCQSLADGIRDLRDRGVVSAAAADAALAGC